MAHLGKVKTLEFAKNGRFFKIKFSNYQMKSFHAFCYDRLGHRVFCQLVILGANLRNEIPRHATIITHTRWKDSDSGNKFGTEVEMDA